MNDIQNYYDMNTDMEWTRLAERHRTEFAVSFRAMKEYLPPPPASVLDVGGGPGRYAIALAIEGYSVTLADLSPANLEYAQARAEEAGVSLAGRHQVNGTDLGRFDDRSFDSVLVMGPLYHLVVESERIQAMREAARVLKPGGTLFAAFITRFSPFRDSAQGYPEWIADNWEYALHLLETGAHEVGRGFTEAYFAHPREVEPLLRAANLEPVIVIGCEGVVAGHESLINKLSGAAWERWVELNYRLGRDPATHGASDHLLAVGRRAG